MKNTYYDKSKNKKAIRIIIRNNYSKELCNNVRLPNKMSNCPSIYNNLYGQGNNSKRIISSTEKKCLKKFSKKKMRQYLKKIEEY